MKLFRTDEQGSVVAYSNGTEITWNCSPTETWKSGESTESSETTKTIKDTASTSSTANQDKQSATEEVSKPAVEPVVEQASTPEKSGENSSGDRAGVTVPEHEEKGKNLVWVPINGGTKYHSKSGCSNMKDPMQVTLDTAIANGYTACKKCH